MTKRVTQEDIIQMNELYLELKTYAAVARETGFSSSTVSKYIIKGYVPQEKIEIKRYDGTKMPTPDFSIFKGVENLGEMCVLSKEEIAGVEELWEEMAI